MEIYNNHKYSSYC